MLLNLKKRSNFSKNVLTLMTGTTIAQAIPIAISPILTRIYTPEDFGTVAIYLAIASLFAVFATARYEMAIVLPKKNEDAANIVFLSLFITICITVISFLIIYFFNKEILNLIANQQMKDWLFIIPLSVFLTGIYQTFYFWIIRNTNYSSISKTKVTQSLVGSSTNLSIGYMGYTSFGLILGNILGQVFGTSILILKGNKSLFKYKNKINFNKSIANAKKYKKFPLINSLHAFIDMLQNSGIILIITTFFGTSIVGFYSLTMRVMSMPMYLIGSAMAQVFYQEASQIVNNKGNLNAITIRMIKKLFLISFPVFLIIILFSPDIFAFVFGEKWRESGVFSQLLAPYFFLRFIISPISQLPNILNKQGTFFMFTIVGNIIMIGTIFLGYLFNDIYSAFMTLSTLMSIYFIILIFWLLKITKQVKEN